MSQRHPVWVAENHVNPCNSVPCLKSISVFPETINNFVCLIFFTKRKPESLNTINANMQDTDLSLQVWKKIFSS